MSGTDHRKPTSFRLRILLGCVLLWAGGSWALPEDPAGAGWVLVSLHLHTMDNPGYHHNPFNPDPPTSYSVKGFEDIARQAREAGIEALIFTDHHSVGIGFDPVFSREKELILLLGMEWTSTEGHMNLVEYGPQGPRDILLPSDPSEREPTEPDSYVSVIEEVHRRGGIAIINHPESPNHRWPENPFGADAVEVYNGTYSHLSFWQRRLQEKFRITGVGGSDYHSWDIFQDRPIAPQPNSPLRPVNLVWTGGERTARGIVEGIRRGRVQILSSPESPRVWMRLDGNGDGRFDEGREGDTYWVPPGKETRVSLQVRVLGGKGADLQLVHKKGPLPAIRVSGNDFVHRFQHTVQPDPNGFLYDFLRVEVRRGEDYALSNPIYLESIP